MFELNLGDWHVALVCLIAAVSILLIIKGGDWFVDAAIWVAEVTRIPKFIVGATIVSFATTLPELMVSAIAAGQGSADMAVGNAIGSVTANTGLILSLTLIFAPFVIDRKDYLFRDIMLIISVALLFVLCLSGVLNPWLSIIMIVILVIFMADNVIKAKKEILSEKLDKNKEALKSEDNKDGEVKKDAKTIVISIVKFVVGIAAIVIGSQLLVDSGSELAFRMGVSEGVIAVTLVAIGTSLPELVTTITSLIKKNSSMSAGNIIGANIIDVCLILPVCAIIAACTGATGLAVSKQSLYLDFPFCLGIVVIALIPSLITKKFQRWQGIVMMMSYITYLVLCVLMTNGIIFA